MRYSKLADPGPQRRAKSNAIAIHNGLDKMTVFFTGKPRFQGKPNINPVNPFAKLISKFLTFNKGK